MNRPTTLSDLIRKAATATVVQKPVLKKKKRTAAKDAKPVPDAIYGVKDAELQAIWDKHQAQKRKPLPKKVAVNRPPRKMYRPVQYRPLWHLPWGSRPDIRPSLASVHSAARSLG